jgi:hypothetical protein
MTLRESGEPYLDQPIRTSRPGEAGKTDAARDSARAASASASAATAAATLPTSSSAEPSRPGCVARSIATVTANTSDTRSQIGRTFEV